MIQDSQGYTRDPISKKKKSLMNISYYMVLTTN